MKFNELQTFAMRKIQVKNLTPKIEKSYPKATNPTPNQLQFYNVPSLRVGRSVYGICMSAWNKVKIKPGIKITI